MAVQSSGNTDVQAKISQLQQSIKELEAELGGQQQVSRTSSTTGKIILIIHIQKTSGMLLNRQMAHLQC